MLLVVVVDRLHGQTEYIQEELAYAYGSDESGEIRVLVYTWAELEETGLTGIHEPTTIIGTGQVTEGGLQAIKNLLGYKENTFMYLGPQ